MKNLAGHPVSIFLFQFEIQNNAIDFVLNENIAKDMYPDIDERLIPLIHACSSTLSRYKPFCKEKTIMDGNILTDNCFEVMLSQGLGKHFQAKEKENLFRDAQAISDLLLEVMGRRTREMKHGTYPGPQTVTKRAGRASPNALGALARERQMAEEFFKPDFDKSKIKQLTPDDMPDGVKAERSYDHRGHCTTFMHEKLGEIGKVVLSSTADNRTLMQTELCAENEDTLDEKRKLLKEIVAIIEARLNAPR